MTLTKLFYRYDEVAELLSFSKKTIERWADEGKLERVYPRDPRSPRITARSIEAFYLTFARNSATKQ